MGKVSGRTYYSVKRRDPQRYFTTRQKRRIMQRDNWECQRCGATLDRENSAADHVIPWSKGGRTAVENGQALCRPCNKAKGNEEPWGAPIGERYEAHLES